ncbi:hypothetical protein D3C85_1813280 [compost metagenome]
MPSLVARAGGLALSTQASQTAFMASKSAMSASQMVAIRILDLSVPAWASRASISARVVLVWAVTSSPGSPT